MPRVERVDRQVVWTGPEGQYDPIPVDGIVIVIDGEGTSYYVPFRAKDKGGEKKDETPYVWEWLNPYDPMGDATLKGVVNLGGGETKGMGEIKNGEWSQKEQDS